MDMIIRDVSDADIDAVLSLNQSEVPHVGSVDPETMRWYATNASYFRVAVSGDKLAAYLVGFRPGTPYTSPNYLWFCEHYDDFAYVDRIVVAKFARRSGIASRLYDDFADTVRGVVEFMTCEVNVKPANESSMTFHRRLGFEKVGTLMSGSGAKEVAFLANKLLPGN